MKQRRMVYYIRALIIAVCAITGTASFFIYSDLIGRAFQSVAHLETDPAFTGGRVSAVFYDPVGDDTGFGSLTYPSHKDFVPGSLDLVRYTVHEPVYNAQWSDVSEYWQLDLSFSSGPAVVRNIRIYIDVDNEGLGSVNTKTEFAEGVNFDAASPWDYVISVQGTTGTLESSDGTFSVPLAVSSSASQKDMTIRVPLATHRLQALYRAGTTRQYVVIGAWAPWNRDGFADVKKLRGTGTGGGALSALTPKIYDLLVPDGMNQAEELGAWNEDELTGPVIHPISVSMISAKGGMKRSPVSATRLTALESAAKQEADADLEARNSLYATALAERDRSPTAPDTEQNLAIAAYWVEKNTEAEKLFDRLLAKNPNDPICLAYKGSLVAKRGGDAPPLAAVDIIAEAYTYLDRAVSLAASDGDRVTAYYNRANVSKAVPDVVFGKALQGAIDFLAAAETDKKISAEFPVGEVASAYCNAAICYEIAGKEDESVTWFMEAARLAADPAVSAEVRLELSRRGLNNEPKK